jgi:hypothetical protein
MRLIAITWREGSCVWETPIDCFYGFFCLGLVQMGEHTGGGVPDTAAVLDVKPFRKNRVIATAAGLAKLQTINVSSRNNRGVVAAWCVAQATEIEIIDA